MRVCGYFEAERSSIIVRTPRLAKRTTDSKNIPSDRLSGLPGKDRGPGITAGARRRETANQGS